MTAPVFEEVSCTAVIEKTLSVAGVEPFTVAARVRYPWCPEPTLTVDPDEVTLSYAFVRGDWVLTGAEVVGVHAARVRYRGESAVVRFVVGVHEDMPDWVSSLASSYRPVNPPG